MSKYALSFVLMILLIGLGTFILCRPSRRTDPEAPPAPPKKKA